MLPGTCDACVELTSRGALPVGARRLTVFGAPLLESTALDANGAGACASGPGLMIPGAAR